MRFLIVVVSMFALLGMAGCTGCNPGCTIEKTVADAVVPAIASGLQCANPSAIQADVEAAIGKIGMCKNSSKPQLPGPVCDVLASMVVSAAGGNIPSSWQCTAANAKDLVKGLISQACQKI